MWVVIISLIIIIVLLIGIAFLIVFIINKCKYFLETYFDSSSLKEAIDKSKLKEEETQKSISSMESIYKNRIAIDFPDLNLNELKSMAEANILNILDTIELKDIKNLKNKNEKIVSFVESIINDLKEDIDIENIKIHKTSLTKYDISESIATIEISSSLEYLKNNKKIQTRFKQEFIYIVDASKISKNVKALGINCPNCGAPVKTLGKKHCEYCSSGIIDIVKKVWVINNIKEY